MTERLTIRRPDDWHVHLRDGAMMETVLPYTARCFARAIVMPNLAPPVVTTADAIAYRDRIRRAIPRDMAFTPLMTCYLTDTTDPSDLERGFVDGVFVAAKLYPAHATTNSAHGVTSIARISRVLDAMQRIGMPLLTHGEATEPGVDVFDREAVFIDRTLTRLLDEHPDLRLVFEHITTSEAVNFVLSTGANVAATVTPHHLTINRNAMFMGGIRPHYYCLPVAKREAHRLALRRAVASGNGKFFLGTDTAPHAAHAKENACGCAGIFNAPHALETYAQVFEEENALEQFEAFASLNGPRFYRLPVNEARVVLERKPSAPPERIAAPDGQSLIPFAPPGAALRWTYAGPVTAPAPAG